MHNEAEVRRLLIDSCHSSPEADRFFRSHCQDSNLLALLVSSAWDIEDYEGDALMQAAFWLSQYAGEMLAAHEPALFEMLRAVNGYAGHIALALGKTHSSRGRELILAQLGDGKRFDAWLFQEALKCYPKDDE